MWMRVSMWTCMCMWILDVHVHAYVCMNLYMDMCMNLYVDVCACACMRVHARLEICICIYVHKYVVICIPTIKYLIQQQDL